MSEHSKTRRELIEENTALRKRVRELESVESEQSPALLAALIDSISDIIFCKDMNGVYLACNDEFARHVGREKSEIIGKTDYDLYPKDQAYFFRENDRLMLEQGSLRRNEEWVSYPDGRMILLETLKVPYRSQDGIIGTIGVCRDITARKRAEAELHLQSLVLDQIQDRVTVTDLDGIITYVNKAVVQLLGCPREEIIGVSTENYGENPDRGGTQQQILEETLKYGTWRGEVVNKTVDGQEVLLDCRTQLVRDDQGNPIALAGISTDITARKRMEEALRNQKVRFESLFTNTNDAIVFTDTEHKVMNINEQFARLFGYHLDEIQGRNINEVVDPHGMAGNNYASQKFLFGENVEMEAVRYRKNGDAIDVLIKGAPVLIEGRVVGGYAIYTDITPKKRSEEALRLSEASVRKKLQAVLEPEGDIGELDLADIIDQQALQAMMDEFYRLTSIGSSVVDISGKVLVATGWQDVCTEFHRVHPEASKNCTESDVIIAGGVDPGAFKTYRCKNNLWNMVTPIFVGNRHMGNVYLGQFFFEDDAPDHALFLKQARQYGFDETEYLAAIERVPRWSRETVDAAMAFFAKLAGVISTLSYSTVNLSRVLSQQDITLLQLRESESRNKAILSAMPDMMFLFDHNGVFLDYHAPKESELAVEPELFVGRRIHDVFPEDISEMTMFHINEILQHGETAPYGYELQISSETRFYESRMVACEGSGFLAVVQDVTDRKRVEDELRANQERLDTILENINDNVWSYDLDSSGNFVSSYISPAGSKMLGITEKELNHSFEVWFSHVFSEDLPKVKEAMAEAVNKGRGSPIDYRIRAADGSVKWVRSVGNLVQKQDGTLSLAGTGLDITELKSAEEEREKLQIQLAQAQKMESVGRLAGGVAHDFNNMLGIILGHTDMALEYLEPGQPVHSDLQEIRKATMRSADLVRQLLAFARKQTIAPKVLDLNDTVEGMLKMIRRLIGEDIDLSWMPGKNLWPVNIDPTQIDQVLANLCVNARDAIDGVGKVTIETENATLDEDDCGRHHESVPGDYVLLAVSDDGCGMEKEILDRLFEPFFTTKEVGKGTGLGLPMIYGIVKQNEGFINVYSEPGRGTIFRIYIPRHSGEPEKKQRQAPDETIRGGDETILLVEDEPMLLQMGKDMLERLGYRVIAAGNPSEALRTAAEHKADIRLLITDVIMPQMNGRDLADQLSKIYPDMKLVFMSGYTANVIAHHGVLDFGVKFVQKPFSMKDLANTIREALES